MMMDKCAILLINYQENIWDVSFSNFQTEKQMLTNLLMK